MNQENKDPTANAVDVASNATNTAKVLVNNAHKLTEMLQAIFGGFNGGVLIGIVAIFICILSVLLIVISLNGSTLFNSETTKLEYIVKALKSGYVQNKKDARGYIANYVNNAYDCNGSLANMSSLVADNVYTFSSWACEITIDFVPELEEFARHIDAHAVAVNSTLQMFAEEESEEVVQISDSLIQIDDEGNIQMSEYGQNYVDSYSSEYMDNQSEAYFDTLKRDSYKVFEYEEDTSEWIFKNFYVGTKLKPVTRCYQRERQPDMTYVNVPVACSLGAHDIEVEEFEEIKAMFGHISVPMNYDVKKYKEDELQEAVNNLVGKLMYSEKDGDIQQVEILDIDQAQSWIDNTVANYEISYMMSNIDESFGFGYSGLISSNGFNYSNAINDPAVTQLFWAYSLQLDSVLHNLPYSTSNDAFGPSMDRQCTQFAATFFYDVYGFAALRGDGMNMADYLIKDCGRNSACPVKFEYSATPAPGAIISLHPNHVVVVDQVDDDGSVYISEGNYNGKGAIKFHQKYSSLSAYLRATGYSLKAMAIPIR